MENSKDIFYKILNLKKANRYPAAPHWWGLYKYEILGLDEKKDAWKEGDSISKVYIDFYEKFKPDWFHLHLGTPKYLKDSEIIKSGNKFYLRIDKKYKSLKKDDKYFSVNSSGDEEIVDFPDYILGSKAYKPKIDLSTKQKIDDFIKRYIYMSAEEIIKTGYTDHLIKIAEKYRNDVFIAVHIPSAIYEIFDPTYGPLGFERGMTALYDQPNNMRYLLEKYYEAQIEWARAYAKNGAHAYIISESFICAPDLVNPDFYRKFMKDIHRDYFGEIKNMGLETFCHFWGDVNPLLEDITEINLKGLLVEETKKNFIIDIKKIRDQIGDRICIFGNIDSINLLHDGTVEEVKEEVQRQLQGANYNFIVSNGSPITNGTPVENVHAMIQEVKNI